MILYIITNSNLGNYGDFTICIQIEVTSKRGWVCETLGKNNC